MPTWGQAQRRSAYHAGTGARPPRCCSRCGRMGRAALSSTSPFVQRLRRFRSLRARGIRRAPIEVHIAHEHEVHKPQHSGDDRVAVRQFRDLSDVERLDLRAAERRGRPGVTGPLGFVGELLRRQVAYAVPPKTTRPDSPLALSYLTPSLMLI